MRTNINTLFLLTCCMFWLWHIFFLHNWHTWHTWPIWCHNPLIEITYKLFWLRWCFGCFGALFFGVYFFMERQKKNVFFTFSQKIRTPPPGGSEGGLAKDHLFSWFFFFVTFPNHHKAIISAWAWLQYFWWTSRHNNWKRVQEIWQTNKLFFTPPYTVGLLLVTCYNLSAYIFFKL